MTIDNEPIIHSTNQQLNNHKKMKTRSLYRLTSLIAVTLFFVASLSLQARDYRMSRLDVDIHLQDDGSMHVREDREFAFEGRYSEVYRTFPLDGPAHFDHFRVFEDDWEYTQNESKEPGTFRIISKNNEQELQVFFSARDVTRTFSIRYVANGAVTRYEDAALLYYQIISDEWTKPIYNITAHVYPPVSLHEGEPTHWVHGSLDALSTIKEDGVVEIGLDRLPRRRFLEIRSLYQPDIFHNMPVVRGHIRDEAIEEATGLVAAANRMREEREAQQIRREKRHALGRQLAIPTALIIIAITVLFFRKYRKKPTLADDADETKRLPEKVKPALVNYLVNQTTITANALVSTLFHLAYNGFLKIEEKQETKKVLGVSKENKTLWIILNRDFWQHNKDTLFEYENKLLSFLFDQKKGPTDRVNLKKLKNRQSIMQQFFLKWKKSVSLEGKKMEWFDKQSEKGRNISMFVNILIMLATVGLIVLLGPWMLIPLFVSFFCLIASFFIFHRTEKGEKAYRRWLMLKKHLKKYHFDSKIKELDSAAVNEYLIYGISLGLGSRFFKKLTRALDSEYHAGYFPWLYLYHTNLSSFGKTIHEVITTTGGAVSSYTGAGGGGTMGGGGGAGSGGGGAR